MSTFPLTADELTVDWLNASLADALNGSRIESFNSKIIGVGEGFMGQLARVSLQTSGNAMSSVIAKFASPSDKTREMARDMRYYEREIGFYRDIGDAVGVPVAHCYYSEHSPETNHFVVLLEDLAPSIPSDQVEGTDPITSRKVIEAMATLHAKWWNSEKLQNCEWAQPIYNAQPIAEGAAMLDRSIADAARTGRFDRYPEMKRLLPMLPPLMKIEPPPPFPFTLCHGDLRSDNVFKATDDGSDFALIDWQLSGMNQPMNDIARWMSQSITIEQRRATEEDLLKLYHAKLVEGGVTGYTYKQMIQEYKLNLVVILLMFSMSMDDIDMTPERTEALFHQMYSRLDAALVDWKIEQILKVLPYMIPFMKLSTWLKQKFKR